MKRLEKKTLPDDTNGAKRWDYFFAGYGLAGGIIAVKIIWSKDLVNPKIYPAYLDPFSQIIGKPNVAQLKRRLYVDAILNEHIIPSISHILGSNATMQLLLDEPELLEKNIIVPFISHPNDSIEGYIDKASMNPDSHPKL